MDGEKTVSNKRPRAKETANYVFTCHEGYNTIEESARSLVELGRLRYLCGQLERCPTTGKEHFQGYLQLRRSATLGSVRKMFAERGSKFHLEPRLGTHEQAVAYCTKEETRAGIPIYIGIPCKGQGTRTDLEEATDLLLQGTKVRDVALEHPTAFVKYHRGFERLAALVADKPRTEDRKVEVIVYWGPTGTGKTRRAKYENPRDQRYDLSPQASGQVVWFDGYSGQPTILIDEFRGQIPFQYLLRLIDPHPSLEYVQVKGGSVPAQWTRVVITSNIHPKYWYNEDVMRREGGKYEGGPLERRVEIEGKLIKMDTAWVPPEPEPTDEAAAIALMDLSLPSLPSLDSPTYQLTEADIDDLLEGLDDV